MLSPYVNRRVVAVHFDLPLAHALEAYRGASDYAQRHPSWVVIPLGTNFEQALIHQIPHGLWGVIGPFISDRWFAPFQARGIRGVNLATLSYLPSLPNIGFAEDHVGRMAADELLDVGCKSLVCCSTSGSYADEERTRAFHTRITEKGSRSVVAPKNPNLWLPLLDRLEGKIGVFCVNDQVARDLLRRTNRRGTRIPTDLCVVGVGDNPLDNLYSDIGITTISLPDYELGHRAARMLDRAEISPTASVLLPPGGLISRGSTRSETGLESPVAALMTRLVSQIAQPVDFDTQAAQLGMGRRSLEMKFRKATGTSPHQWLMRKRMEEAQRLLRQSRLNVSEIAAAVGYGSIYPFSFAFKRFAGVSPIAFRNMGDG
jgi:LacI family transcriptional regulator